MKLSFVIPAHNEEAYIDACLESIVREIQHVPAELTIEEIIVVNNASTDRTREVAEHYPGVRVVDEPRKGLTVARERGLKEAKGDLLAYLDADTRMPSGWLSKVAEEFSRRKDVVSLSGPYRYHDLPRLSNFFAKCAWRIFVPITYFFVRYMVLGGNFVAKKSALMQIGGFDTELEFYGEDTEIARRLHAVGHVLFRMDFFVWTSGRRLRNHGLVRSYFIYAMNYLWEVLFHKPFTKGYKDIR